HARPFEGRVARAARGAAIDPRLPVVLAGVQRGVPLIGPVVVGRHALLHVAEGAAEARADEEVRDVAAAAAAAFARDAEVVAADQAGAAVGVDHARRAHAGAAALRVAALHAGRALGLSALLGRRAAGQGGSRVSARADDRDRHRVALRSGEAERAAVTAERDDVVLDLRLIDVGAGDLEAVAARDPLHRHALELAHAVALVEEVDVSGVAGHLDVDG